MWRQGDILFERVNSIPSGAEPINSPILAAGDSTGHGHRIRDRRQARLYHGRGIRSRDMFLEVLSDQAHIVHPEHAEIVLSKGIYRVWRQREWTAWGVTNVAD